MVLIPDDKNWTWVLERACPECSFDARAYARETIGARIRSNAQHWTIALTTSDAAKRTSNDQWSVLEYGCHVRDVYRIYRERVTLMLNEAGAAFENWDQDATAVLDRYDKQDPAEVAQALVSQAGLLAKVFDGIAESEHWQYNGTRSDGSTFTVESISRYMLHDTIHHLVDIGLTPSEAGAI